MNRAITVSAASGSLSAFLWQLAHEFLQQQPVQPVPSCPLPEVLPAALLEQTEVNFKDFSLDLPSLLLGILIGLSACMSSVPVSRAEFDKLVAEVQTLTALVQRLTIQGGPKENSPSGVSSASFEVISGGASTVGDSVAVAASDLSSDRIAAANCIGAWVKRCFAGQLRGLSGREKISLASRYYLVFRSVDLEVFNPPLVFTSWRDAKAKAEAEEEELGAETIYLRAKLITSAEGEVDPEYSVGILAAGSGPSIACIGVAEVDGKYLCAFPEAAWHRTKIRRQIAVPFAKPVAVVVPTCAQDGREIPDHDVPMKVWLGLISEEAAMLVEYGPFLVADVGFPVDTNGLQLLPFAESLVAAARDHFTFLSLSEAPPTGGGMENRLKVVEDGLGKLQSTLDAFLAQQSSAKSKEAVRKRPSALRGKGEAASGLDPLVARNALQAGVTPDALSQIAKLSAVGAAPKSKARAPEAEDELSSDEEEEGDAASVDGSADPMVRAVTQMSKVLKELHSDKREKKAKTLDNILDRAESGSTKDTLSYGKSRAGALRSLQALLKSNPVLIYQELERRLQEDWELNGVQPGLQSSTVSARGWVEYRSRISAYPSSIRSAWALAGIWDCLRANKIEEARARAGLALAQIDQQSCDRGNWLLAAEISLEPAPPSHSFQNHVPPETWEVPHTRLIDPRWFELMLAKLKDFADFQEKKQKLNSSSSAPRPKEASPAKPEPKKNAKGGGKEGKKGKPQAADAGGNAAAPAAAEA
eukprot:s4063_g3.t1